MLQAIQCEMAKVRQEIAYQQQMLSLCSTQEQRQRVQSRLNQLQQKYNGLSARYIQAQRRLEAQQIRECILQMRPRR